MPDGTESRAGVAWRREGAPVAYEAAIAAMEARADAIRAGTAGELVWLLEHRSLYTAGTSARPEELLGTPPFPVHKTGRGGRYTYHGPGQRVAYVMLDLAARGRDVRCFVYDLEDWAIAALGRLGVAAERRQGRIGLWVARGGGREDKIAAIGVRVRRWVTFHGLSINVNPDLSHFSGIVPCGIAEPHLGITSLADLGVKADMAALDDALGKSFAEIFGAGGRGRCARA